MSDASAATWSGLSTAEVAQRTAEGRVNRTDQRSSRTVGEIIRANVFTRFNAVIATLMAIVLALGEWRDALFGFVMILNLAIGVVQEWRAKTDPRSTLADQRAQGGRLARRRSPRGRQRRRRDR